MEISLLTTTKWTIQILILNYLLVFFACHCLLFILLSTVSAVCLYFASSTKYLVWTLPRVLFGSLLKLLFAAHDASLWYSTTSLCCNVSPWWHICSSIHASGNHCQLWFHGVIILLLNHQFTNHFLLIAGNLHRDLIHILMPCLLQTVLLRPPWVFPPSAFLCSFFLLLCLSFSYSVKGLSLYK